MTLIRAVFDSIHIHPSTGEVRTTPVSITIEADSGQDPILLAEQLAERLREDGVPLDLRVKEVVHIPAAPGRKDH